MAEEAKCLIAHIKKKKKKRGKHQTLVSNETEYETGVRNAIITSNNWTVHETNARNNQETENELQMMKMQALKTTLTSVFHHYPTLF